MFLNNRVSMQELMFDSSVQQTHLEVLKSILNKREKSRAIMMLFMEKLLTIVGLLIMGFIILV